MKVYLDTCCLNRPFDDQSQPRIRLESEAVLVILHQAVLGKWTLVGSEAIDDEISQTPDLDRRGGVEMLAKSAQEYVEINPQIRTRGQLLKSKGFGTYDALHLSCAESIKADILLTTDDRFIKKANKHQTTLSVIVRNPLEWLTENLP